MENNLLLNRTKYCNIEQNVLLSNCEQQETDKMIITATELKSNLGKYLDLVNEEDILITKNGKEIARLSSPISEKITILNSLVGICEGLDDIDYREERLSRQ